MRYVAALVLALVMSGSAYAQRASLTTDGVSAQGATLTCTSVTDIKSIGNVLYKNENVHGGRGRTFLDQGRRLRGVRTLKVAGTNGTIYSCFGLYKCDSPFGCRYYQAMCKDSLSNSQFAARAKANGGTYYALVGAGNGPCFKILTNVSRYGSVRK